jgi:hypothetical protein
MVTGEGKINSHYILQATYDPEKMTERKVNLQSRTPPRNLSP